MSAGTPITKNFILTLAIGISFGFGFALVFMKIASFGGSESVYSR